MKTEGRDQAAEKIRVARAVMLLTGSDTIREVILFPKDYHYAVSDRINFEFSDSQIEVFIDENSVGTIELTLWAPSHNATSADDLEFFYQENGPLSNGDILTDELGDYYLNEILEGMKPLGYTIENTRYELMVTGL